MISSFPKFLKPCLAMALVMTLHQRVRAQETQENEPKTGYEISVPIPLDTSSATQLVKNLTLLTESLPEDRRTTVVLKLQNEATTSAGKTAFEDALKVARAITSPKLRRLKIVTYLDGEISGHVVLTVIASEALVTTQNAVLGNASADEESPDPTIRLTYESIAERRGLFPKPMVAALVDPGLELAEITRLGGEQEFVTTSKLAELRKEGKILSENVISPAGTPLQLDARTLRRARISAGLVNSFEQASEVLDLAELKPLQQAGVLGAANGVLLEITGSIVPGRVQRWQSNLNATLTSDEINTWLISIDSTGGDLNGSMTLAGWFSKPSCQMPRTRTHAVEWSSVLCASGLE